MAAPLMPDPAVMAQAMQNIQQSTVDLSVQFNRIGNLPAFAGPQTLENRMIAMEVRWQDRMTAMEDRIDARMTAMEDRIDARITAMDDRINARMIAMENRLTERITTGFNAIDVKLLARDKNTAARIDNSFLRDPTDDLQPFVNTTTGEEIPEFPATPRALDGLTMPNLRIILQGIGEQSRPGLTVTSLRQLLRKRIGLKPEHMVGAGI